MLIGLAHVERSAHSPDVMAALMRDQMRRAVLAFPDEDVLIGTRMVHANAFEAFAELNDIVPRPGHKASGEERAWGRRLAKRFGIEAANYDDRAFLARGDGVVPCRFDYVSGAEPDAEVGAVLRPAHAGQRRRADRLRLGHGRVPRRTALRCLTASVQHGERRRRRAAARPAAVGGRRAPPPDDPGVPSRPGTGIARRRADRAGRPVPLRRQHGGPALRGPRPAPEVEGYWSVTLPAERRAAFPWPGLLDAPVLLVPCVSAEAYAARYADAGQASPAGGVGGRTPLPRRDGEVGPSRTGTWTAAWR